VVLMLSADDPHSRDFGLALGAVDCINQPLDATDLLARVRAQLD